MNLTSIKTDAVRALALAAMVGIVASASAQEKSLYERLGGIHKIALFVDTAVMNSRKDDVLMGNKNFAMVNKNFPAPAIDFILTNYIANKTGGPQMYGGVDVMGVQKWFMLTPMQQDRQNMIIVDAMKSAGIDQSTSDEFIKWYMSAADMATPMMPSPEMIMDKSSLYGRLGGIVPITVVVDDFINHLATDKTITSNPHVVTHLTDGHVSPQGLKYLVTEQLAAASGGPYKYSGRSMADSHQGLMISEEEWTAGAHILMNTLDKYHVPKKEQGEILGVVSSTKSDIVNR